MIVVAETGSTNDDMAALAGSGASEGLWLRAERQTGGKGRAGRVWSSQSGNLHISTLVKRQPGDPASHTLALVAAVAAHAAVAELAPAIAVTIKWPNDLMVEQPASGSAKLCGMLLEARGDAVIVGFGMNVTHAPEIEERTTTSLASCGARADSDAARTAEVLAEQFARWLDCWRREGLDRIRQAWLKAAHPVGTSLRVLLPDGTQAEGGFAGLAADGALLLMGRDGRQVVIHAGDVFAL
ncbi:biotin--[acetyl-CoA-carboxylase] ligase [Sphingobium sufflavum]|uniref:biotin--[acetyl-CoA-carboxylase] ligase n=1 Tax=Sphingobium sufflavum TaxID=1129547 RepID=UPI00389A804D